MWAMNIKKEKKTGNSKPSSLIKVSFGNDVVRRYSRSIPHLIRCLDEMGLNEGGSIPHLSQMDENGSSIYSFSKKIIIRENVFKCSILTYSMILME